MPINSPFGSPPPDSAGVNTGGSGNTECLCFVNTHDRGPDNPSQKIDLSPYLTSVGISQHLTGGGAANITLPAVDFIEDIIAAGDMINIYFHTHRGDLDIYNRGRVRTFFGYIQNVTKSVSVGAAGEKLTMYTIACKDFSKAIRDTEIYNNPHMSAQSMGGNKSEVRKDLSANLGGIALLTAGIAIQGSPRQIIIQNLMRLLGFGAQWALPISYNEVLPGSSSNLKLKKVKTKESLANTLQGAMRLVLKEGEDAPTGYDGTQYYALVKQEFADILAKLAKLSVEHKKTVSALWDAVTLDDQEDEQLPHGPELMSLRARIRHIKNRYLATKFEINFEGGSKSGYINNTFFALKGITKSKISKGMGPNIPDVTVGSAEQGLKEDLKIVTNRVLNEIEGVHNDVINEFGSNPKANLFAEALQNMGLKHEVRTIFNILCLDYLEDCDGFWPNASTLTYQGSLLSLLDVGANSVMNELFFDLRPSPMFQALPKDGLGVPLNGALPMVPAAVLRMKPFTNYPNPKDQISNSQVSGNLVTGGVKVKRKGTNDFYFGDQLVINSGGALGAYAAAPIPSSELNKGKVTGSLETVTKSGTIPNDLLGVKKLKTVADPEVKKKTKKVLSPKGKKRAQEKAEKKYKDEVEKLAEQLATKGIAANSDINAMYEKAMGSPIISKKKAAEFIGLVKGQSNFTVARKAFSNFVTLPRPIFRSPDNNRITREVDISGTQYILGVKVPAGEDASKTNFMAFSTSKKNTGISPAALGGNIPLTSLLDPKNKGKNALLEQGSSMFDINNRLTESNKLLSNTEKTQEEADKINYHVLDYTPVYNEDCTSESYTRGDFGVVNMLELWGNAVGDVQAQRLFLGTIMPIVTPTSIYRFGVRVLTQSTQHVQALLSGEVDHDHQKNVLLRWVVLQDLWIQHNHELLAGSVATRGFPGIRPGYRIDRPELNLSFYVEGVNHTWTFPGYLITQLSVSRGQPSGAQNALKYYRPRPSEDPAGVDRQELGRVFKTGKFKRGSQEYDMEIPGTFTGSNSVGKQIKVKKRKKSPKVVPRL